MYIAFIAKVINERLSSDFSKTLVKKCLDNNYTDLIFGFTIFLSQVVV